MKQNGRFVFLQGLPLIRLILETDRAGNPLGEPKVLLADSNLSPLFWFSLRLSIEEDVKSDRNHLHAINTFGCDCALF